MSTVGEQSKFYTGTVHQLRAAQSVAQLEAVARILDSEAFRALPADVREDLTDLYRSRLVLITGATG